MYGKVAISVARARRSRRINTIIERSSGTHVRRAETVRSDASDLISAHIIDGTATRVNNNRVVAAASGRPPRRVPLRSTSPYRPRHRRVYYRHVKNRTRSTRFFFSRRHLNASNDPKSISPDPGEASSKDGATRMQYRYTRAPGASDYTRAGGTKNKNVYDEKERRAGRDPLFCIIIKTKRGVCDP